MGKKQADMDGVKYGYEMYGVHEVLVYYVPCSKCGTITKKRSYGRNFEYIYDNCKEKTRIIRKKRNAFVDQLYDTITTKEERRFDKAVDAISSQVRIFATYEQDVEIARRAQFKYGSVPEAMAAIELIHLGYSIIPQQKVGKYRVDFYIPKEKIVIEVDGEVYHHDTFKGDREATIQFSLGLDVKIIHIPAETIRRNVLIIDKVMRKICKEP